MQYLVKYHFNLPPPGSPPVHKNMPVVAGALGWAQELRARIQAQFGCFRHIMHPCVSS